MLTFQTGHHWRRSLVLLTAGGAANDHVPADTTREGLDLWARASLKAGTVRG